MDSYVCGFHIYQDLYGCLLSVILREMSNREKRYAIAVNKPEGVVGHIPHMILSLCAVYIGKVE